MAFFSLQQFVLLFSLSTDLCQWAITKFHTSCLHDGNHQEIISHKGPHHFSLLGWLGLWIQHWRDDEKIYHIHGKSVKHSVYVAFQALLLLFCNLFQTGAWGFQVAVLKDGPGNQAKRNGFMALRIYEFWTSFSFSCFTSFQCLATSQNPTLSRLCWACPMGRHLHGHKTKT